MKEKALSLAKRSLVWQFVILLIFFTNILAANDVAENEGKVEITGELKMWHKVTLTFDGPNTSETADYNPFTSYLLDVTFKKGGESYLVPGYFAADGNAANTGASEGNKWRVHFSPPAKGTWEYDISFRKGTNIHAADSPAAGESAAFMDGVKGTFKIKASDKKGRDMRARGWLEYIGGHYLRFKGNGEYFQEFIDNLIKVVDEHISDTDLNIELIADSLGMSRSTFFRKIKAITGTTDKDFIDSIRLKKASQL